MKNMKLSSNINTPKNQAIINKLNEYLYIIQKTIISIQKYKVLDLISASDINTSIETLENMNNKLNNILQKLKQKNKIDIDSCIKQLQVINDDLALLFSSYGTEHINDVIKICFGNDFIESLKKENNNDKYDLLSKFFHPTSYKIIPHINNSSKHKLNKTKNVEDNYIIDNNENFDCYDLCRTTDIFHYKVYGIRVALHNNYDKKSIIISGIMDDIIVSCLNNTYISTRLIEINNFNKDKNQPIEYLKYIKSLTVKEILIYNNKEIYNRYMGYKSQINMIKQKSINAIVNEFINNDLFHQRLTLIQLLLHDNNPESKYLAYLLYDLLSNDNNGNIDTTEQTMLYDSLPWDIKQSFRDAMKETISYTNNLSNFDNNKIPLEQQICLMKVKDTVKEKAMVKLKELKSKEDNGTKARQYLEGLLKIPFGCYRNEYILSLYPNIKELYNNFIIKSNHIFNTSFNSNINITNIEIKKNLLEINNKYIYNIKSSILSNFILQLSKSKRNEVIIIINKINNHIKNNKLNYKRLCHSKLSLPTLKNSISDFFNMFKSYDNINDIIYSLLGNKIKNDIQDITVSYSNINSKLEYVSNGLNDINNILNKATHGHDNAKRQIQRIIGQWINGEQTGYCFGFEGPPGVGKTSLAKKGIAYCLKDADDSPRPFSFIAIGGSSNGSVLEGHNYTYVGSTWGKIVDVLIENKCMNPIIFIDELDKVSRTEHGREIIGILTHIIDTTQNDSFQDKYFNGIDIDLSKALFVFSYNDVDAIDKILLDRIHRIKFDTLSLDDKISITNNFILPELLDKMGLTDNILFSNDVIIFIIDNYTNEPGVRKLKELFFEIIGEINIEILKNEQFYDIPINITIDNIKLKYLKDRREINHKKIPCIDNIGIINGLWANSQGQGGIIPIEVKYFPTNTYLELKLTGMQGDVMKESMNVAKTLAFNITNKPLIKKLNQDIKNTNLQGIHIHCPEGATPKDGPSAGTAITVAIYSLINNKKIKNNIAITGEINLQGNVTEIGGLDLKILGGIKGGVKEFIFPSENLKEYNDFREKYKNKMDLKHINFHMINNIQQALDIILI